MTDKNSELCALVDDGESDGIRQHNGAEYNQFQRRVLCLSSIGIVMLLVAIASARVAIARRGMSARANEQIYVMTTGGRNEKPDGNRKLEHVSVSDKFSKRAVIIALKAVPSMCWSVLNTPQHNAKKIISANCSQAERWIIPEVVDDVRIGNIRWERHPEFCLDHPGSSSIIQLWNCSDAPKQNTLFHVPNSTDGSIKTARGKPVKCLDVPHHSKTDRKYVQAWQCGEDYENGEEFVISWPQDCEWSAWSEWTSCAAGQKHQMRSRSKALPEADGGKPCDGISEEQALCSHETSVRFLFRNVSRFVSHSNGQS